MFDIRVIRESGDKIQSRLGDRGKGIDWDLLLKLDVERRDLLTQVEKKRHRRKTVLSEIGKLKCQGKPDDTKLLQEVEKLAEEIRAEEAGIKPIEDQLNDLLLRIPNIPHETVPSGENESHNEEFRRWGTPPQLTFSPVPHVELGESLDILDFKRATRMSGSRFTIYKGAGAQLERALMNYMLDLHTQNHGYLEVIPPYLVNRAGMTGTGQLPKFESDLFYIASDDFFLIPTAEVSVTNIHREEILDSADLPLRYVAGTPCFRREAGSYGKDTRGLIRQHQFNKVELVSFTNPEESYDELDRLLIDVETVLQQLGLHYRVVTLCSGDMGFSAAKTYDVEVWMPVQGVFREISSCSNFEAFQARRARIKFRGTDGKTDFVHTLNGSGVAIGRTVVAILETFQQKDGSVLIPKALHPYMGGIDKIEKR
ncbi:MAG: serine--tRNA ligase [Nitrospiraceae bacterium]|nr:serine--tRNA ligase [Nitrospiraceae bacterium]|tara:strand:+ start:613 stop:1890 length:1278 start_codon:yes stop_codon:yes gene_type:complete